MQTERVGRAKHAPAPSLTTGFLLKDVALLGIFGVAAGRCAAGNPQQARRLLTASRNLVVIHWLCDDDVRDANTAR
jgi:hypothetical protein